MAGEQPAPSQVTSLVCPCFPRRLVGYQLVMQEQANRLCELLAQHCADGTYCDILEELNAVNLSVVGFWRYMPLQM